MFPAYRVEHGRPRIKPSQGAERQTRVARVSIKTASMGAAIVLSGAFVLSTPASAVTISNTSDSFEPVKPFGVPDSQTFGEIFTAPVTGKLTSFTLYLNGGVGSLEGAVGTWNGTGSPTTLYKSAAQVSSGAQAFTFSPGVDVTAGQKYVAFLSVYGDPNASGYTSMPLTITQTKDLGFFTLNNTTFGGGSPYGNPAWTSIYIGASAEFTGTFVAKVPEPATWAMMLVGFGGLGSAMRSRRKLAATTV